MTNEEMEKRWPTLPPFKATFVNVFDENNNKYAGHCLTQDTIDDIIAYFEAARESMNE